MVDAMGMTHRERQNLVAYQLLDVAEMVIVKWRDSRPLCDGPVDWEVLKEAFYDILFSIDLREKNMVEFTNLHKGEISVIVYSLKFTQPS